MTEPAVVAGAHRGPALLRESPAPLAGLPLYELAAWRERFGVIGGITARGEAAGRGFDLGLWSAEPVGAVMTRWRQLRQSEPRLGGTLLGSQVHGADVRWHDGAEPGWLQVDGVDGHATAAQGVRLCVTVADCVPVYLLVPDQRAAALLHAGWRGTAAGILERGVSLLRARLGCAAASIVAHMGVGICGACYEVGAEVMRGCGHAAEGPGPWHIDLRAELASRAGALGLGDVTVSPWCSAHDRPRFYSHRASAGADGRMVAFLGWPALPGAPVNG